MTEFKKRFSEKWDLFADSEATFKEDMLDFFLKEKQVSYYQAISDILEKFDENWELDKLEAIDIVKSFLEYKK